jgi:prepilin-type N-terminal cleavage/methylation domain-containing protein
MSVIARLRARAAAQRGFTIIEVLVATLAGAVVATASLYTVIVSIDFSSNYQDRIDSNQQGRLAMQRVVQALDSACVAPLVPPIVAGSSATKIVFYSNEADAATVEPNLVTVALSGGALTMGTQTWVSGNYPSYAFSSTVSSFTLLPHAAQATLNGIGSQPVFQYYGYTAGGVLSTTPYAVPLSAANAATTAEVAIAFQALPSDNWSATGRGADFDDSVVLRLTPASAAATASNAPCT